MTEFFLMLGGFLIGYGVNKMLTPAEVKEVKIKILVDSKQAILDLNQAEAAIKKLKKEMNL